MHTQPQHAGQRTWRDHCRDAALVAGILTVGLLLGALATWWHR